jgi:DNA-binding MarR family transcriptional regulator
MEPALFFLRDLPTPGMLRALAKRYPDMDPSAVQTCALLLRTGSDLLATFEKLLAGYELSQGGFLVLIVLNRDPADEVTPSTLAQKLGVTRATVTGLLDTLAKSGLVERRQDDDDRRRVLLRLTATGRERLDAMLPGYYGQITRIMSGVTERDRELLMGVLEKLNGPDCRDEPSKKRS